MNNVPIIVLLLFTLASCATPSQVTETYRAADLSDATFSKLLVVGVAGSANNRRLFEDALVANLGGGAMVSYQEITEIGAINHDTVVAAVKTTGADGVLVTRIKDLQARAKGTGGRTDVQAQRKDDTLVDFFRYDYQETTDPESIELLTTVVVTSDLYQASDEQRIYAIQSATFDQEALTEIAKSLSNAIAGQLRRTGLVR